MKKSQKVAALLLSGLLLVSAAGCKSSKDKNESWVTSYIEIDDGTDSQASAGSKTDKKNNNSSKNNQSKSSSNKGGNKTGANSAEMSYFENAPAKLDGTTVHFATWIDHNRNESAQVIADFTDITGIKVKLTTIAQTDYISKLTGLVAAGESPDVIVNNGEWPKVLPLLKPLNETILNTKDTFWDQDIVKMYTVNGKPYLVNVRNGAWDMGGACVVYNKRIFEDNGIGTPSLYYQEGRWTLDNFFKCAKELKKVTKDGGVGIELNTFLAAYSSSIISYDSASQSFKSNINDAKFNSTLQRLIEARDAGYANVTDDGTRYLFEDERIGMLLCGTYGLRKTGWFNQLDQDDIEFVLMPKETASSAQVYGNGGGRSYGICKGAKNADGAAYFLRYFLNMDFYDKDEIFKNDDCAELDKQIKANMNRKSLVSTDTVISIVTGASGGIYKIFPELKTCTASQISAALKSGSNSLNACIDRANQMIKDAK